MCDVYKESIVEIGSVAVGRSRLNIIVSITCGYIVIIKCIINSYIMAIN